MSFVAEIAWDSTPDPSRKYWRLYVSEDPGEKGDLVAELNPYTSSHDVPVDEREYTFRALSVSLAGVEEDWQGSKARCEYTVTGEDHRPSAMTGAGGARIYGGSMWGVALDPPAAGNPRQRIQLIRGGEFTGQAVGEVPVPFERERNECGDRFTAPVGMASAGRGGGGGSIEFAVRGVSEDGSAPGTAATFSMPHMDFPNFNPTVLASVVGATLTGFSAAVDTDGFEYSAGVGCILRELPTAATATTANGWGTVASGLLTDEPYGAYYVTGATIRSQELDMGSSVPFVLECYDEWKRASETGIFATLRAGDTPYPVAPQAAEGWNGKPAGPAWAMRQVRGDGKMSRPVRKVRWQWRAGDSSPVTGLAWREYPAPVWIKARYVQTRYRVDEPLGTHQLASERIYVRAWVPWSEDKVPTENLPIHYASLLVGDGSTAMGLEIAPALMTLWAATGASYGADASTASNLITVSTTGYYDIFWDMAGFSGTANSEIHGHLYIAGAAQTEGWHRKLGGADAGSAGCHATGKHILSGQTVACYVNATAASKSMTAIDAQFSIRRVR